MPTPRIEQPKRTHAGGPAGGAAYDQLRQAARRYIRRTTRGGLLQTTALANEAWLKLRRLLDSGGPASGALIATVLRSILVDAARREGAARRGKGWRRVPLDPLRPVTQVVKDADLLDLDEAMAALERTSPRAARIVELRFFGGLSVSQAAAILGVSERTVGAEFRLARAILRSRLEAM